MPHYAQTLTTLFALGALGATFLLVLALCYRLVYGAWAPKSLEKIFARHALLFASIVPVLAFFLSLWYEMLGFAPCALCWFTRTMMYPLALMLPLATFYKDARVTRYAYPLIFIGTAIAFYQHLLQMGVLSEGVCQAFGGVPCATRYVFEFGFVTLPFFGLVAFLTTAYFLRFVREK